MAEAQFVIFEKELLKMKSVTHKSKVDKEGKPLSLELTGNLKILYQYMLDRYCFFSSNNKEFFDNQDDIAENIAMSKRTVVNLLKELVEIGLVVKTTKRIQGSMHSNAYVVLDIFDDSIFVTGSPLKKSLIVSKEKPQQKQVVPQPRPVQHVVKKPIVVGNFYDDPELPF